MRQQHTQWREALIIFAGMDRSKEKETTRNHKKGKRNRSGPKKVDFLGLPTEWHGDILTLLQIILKGMSTQQLPPALLAPTAAVTVSYVHCGSPLTTAGLAAATGRYEDQCQ